MFKESNQSHSKVVIILVAALSKDRALDLLIK